MEKKKLLGFKIDPKLERDYWEVMKERQSNEHKLRLALDRYRLMAERAVKHGIPIPIAVE